MVWKPSFSRLRCSAGNSKMAAAPSFKLDLLPLSFFVFRVVFKFADARMRRFVSEPRSARIQARLRLCLE